MSLAGYLPRLCTFCRRRGRETKHEKKPNKERTFMKKNDLLRNIKRTVIVGLAGACTSIVLANTTHCYTYANDQKCATSNICSSGSPNCSPNSRYPGTVTDHGTRTITRQVTYWDFWAGYKAPSRDKGPCTWVCTVTSDCAGQSPQNTGYGAHNIAPGTNSCEY